jgi:hypothetical protein
MIPPPVICAIPDFMHKLTCNANDGLGVYARRPQYFFPSVKAVPEYIRLNRRFQYRKPCVQGKTRLNEGHWDASPISLSPFTISCPSIYPFYRHTYGKSGKVVFVFGIKSRHLGCFTPTRAQPLLTQPSATPATICAAFSGRSFPLRYSPERTSGARR